MASPAVAEFAEDTADPQEDVEEQEENDEVRALKYTTSARGSGDTSSHQPPQLVVPSVTLSIGISGTRWGRLCFFLVTDNNGLANPRLMKALGSTRLARQALNASLRWLAPIPLPPRSASLTARREACHFRRGGQLIREFSPCRTYRQSKHSRVLLLIIRGSIEQRALKLLSFFHFRNAEALSLPTRKRTRGPHTLPPVLLCPEAAVSEDGGPGEREGGAQLARLPTPERSTSRWVSSGFIVIVLLSEWVGRWSRGMFALCSYEYEYVCLLLVPLRSGHIRVPGITLLLLYPQ